MKTEAEIKDFIDSRKVLTTIELSKFILGYKSLNYAIVKTWWFYVLQTKDLEELQKYKAQKIREAHKYREYDSHPQKKTVLKLMKKDIRLKNAGTRKMSEYLLRFYNIKISRIALKRWRKENEKIN